MERWRYKSAQGAILRPSSSGNPVGRIGFGLRTPNVMGTKLLCLHCFAMYFPLILAAVSAGCNDTSSVERKRTQEEVAIEELTQFGKLTVEQDEAKRIAVAADFSEATFDDDTLIAIKELKNLRKLDLSDTNADDGDLENLKDLAYLTELHLGPSSDGSPRPGRLEITDKGLTSIKGLKHLTKLYLKGSNFTDDALERIQPLTSLTFLSLEETSISDAGLLRLTKLPLLKELDLTDTDITDAGLNNLKSLPRLETLTLDGTSVTDSGLARVTEMKKIKSLSLRFGDDYALPPGGHSPTSNSMHESSGRERCQEKDGQHITGRGIDNLGALNSLEWLSVTGASFTDDELVHVTHLPKLKGLVIMSNAVSDRGLTHLKELRNLEEFQLASRGVTDAGLANLEGLSKLRWLDLEGSNVTGAGAGKLRIALPNCDIFGEGL